MTLGAEPTVVATAVSAFVTGATAFEAAATGSGGAPVGEATVDAFDAGCASVAGTVGLAASVGDVLGTVLPNTVGVPPNVVLGGLGMAKGTWPGFGSVASAPVTPCTVPCNEFCAAVRRESAMVPIGPRAGLVDVLGASARWLLLVEEPESGSAVAIAPPALPTMRPVESTQTPAAMRSCVEMVISSHQPAVPSVGNS
jgi:hypothetical protein